MLRAQAMPKKKKTRGTGSIDDDDWDSYGDDYERPPTPPTPPLLPLFPETPPMTAEAQPTEGGREGRRGLARGAYIRCSAKGALCSNTFSCRY